MAVLPCGGPVATPRRPIASIRSRGELCPPTPPRPRPARRSCRPPGLRECQHPSVLWLKVMMRGGAEARRLAHHHLCGARGASRLTDRCTCRVTDACERAGARHEARPAHEPLRSAVRATCTQRRSRRWQVLSHTPRRAARVRARRLSPRRRCRLDLVPFVPVRALHPAVSPALVAAAERPCAPRPSDVTLV